MIGDVRLVGYYASLWEGGMGLSEANNFYPHFPRMVREVSLYQIVFYTPFLLRLNMFFLLMVVVVVVV